MLGKITVVNVPIKSFVECLQFCGREESVAFVFALCFVAFFLSAECAFPCLIEHTCIFFDSYVSNRESPGQS